MIDVVVAVRYEPVDGMVVVEVDVLVVEVDVDATMKLKLATIDPVPVDTVNVVGLFVEDATEREPEADHDEKMWLESGMAAIE